MTLEHEVDAFLKSFKQKINFWELLVADKREEIIKNLTIKNYCKGPEKPNYGTDIWIFGHHFKGKEIYIKLTLGAKNSPALCISFHTARHPLNYPFKN